MANTGKKQETSYSVGSGSMELEEFKARQRLKEENDKQWRSELSAVLKEQSYRDREIRRRKQREEYKAKYGKSKWDWS